MTSPTPIRTTPPRAAPVPVLELSCRDRAILRAVAAGGAELLTGRVPDLLLDGRCCADQSAVHRLAHAGLITTASPTGATGTAGGPGQRLPARLTAAGLALAAGRATS